MATVHSTARDEYCTSLCLVNEATSAGVVLFTATRTEAWWLIWLANCTKWEIYQYKIPILHTPLATLWHLPTKYAQEKSPQVVNHGDLEMWILPFMQLVRQLLYWVQSPRATPTTKWQAHICTEMSISAIHERRPTTHLQRATTCQAHQTSSVTLLCFQNRNRYVYS
jgi:hypothetical protein